MAGLGSEPPSPHAGLPLSGLRVVSLEQAVSGPFCTRQLADMGADVVKVEHPDGGDLARSYDGSLNGTSAYFAWLNRGKRSVALDLKEPAHHGAMRQLLRTADIFVHNLRPGAVERLGFGWDAVSLQNPRLIWVGISGYGPDGPDRERKAYDLLIQCEAGVVSQTGTTSGPAKVGISIADIASGMYGFSSAIAALLQRQRTGRGERIDISMLECLVEWTMAPIYAYVGTGTAPQPTGMRHNMIVPYGAYPCRDGHVVFAVQTDAEWKRFCSIVLENGTLSNSAPFATNSSRVMNRDALEGLIEERFALLSTADVTTLLKHAGLAYGVVNTIQDVLDHAQLRSRQRWTQVQTPSGQVMAFVPPHNLSGAPPAMGPVPRLGQHTDDVLAEVGLELGERT